jgi:hypothetical protein
MPHASARLKSHKYIESVGKQHLQQGGKHRVNEGAASSSGTRVNVHPLVPAESGISLRTNLNPHGAGFPFARERAEDMLIAGWGTAKQNARDKPGHHEHYV